MESYESSGKITAVKPVAVRGEGVPDYRLPPPSTYSYRLGEHLLIHPVTHGATDKAPPSADLGGVVQMTFPAEGHESETNTWLSWWSPHDSALSVTVTGGQEFTQSIYVPIDSFPVYVRQGAFLPLYRSSEDQTLLFTWYAPSVDSDNTAIAREPLSEGPGLESGVSLSADGMLSGWITAHPTTKSKTGYGWQVVGVTKPDNVTFKSNDVKSCVWSYEDAVQTLTLSCVDGTEGLIFEAFGVKSTL
jgi:alpha-glucosidase (family GH31 glycosyl hydrolase)